MRDVAIVTFLFALAFGLGACGSDDSSSGVPGSKLLVDLTDAERGMMCDWIAGKFGGYGSRMACSDGRTRTTYPNQAACVADAPTASSTPNCIANVSQFEACENSLPQCPTDADIHSSSACAIVTDC